MDVAVNLVESYLRLNGYFTLSEFEILGRAKDGTFRTLTDVDIVGLRLPGDVETPDHHDDARLLMIRDPALRLEPDEIDVIIGEVKQGEAVFNPGLMSPRVLQSVLERIRWIYDGDVSRVVDELCRHGLSVGSSFRGAGVRTRLVAFGRSSQVNLHTMSLSHIVEQMTSFMSDFNGLLRSANFKDPAPALLRLLAKTGFTVSKERGSEEAEHRAPPDEEE